MLDILRPRLTYFGQVYFVKAATSTTVYVQEFRRFLIEFLRLQSGTVIVDEIQYENKETVVSFQLYILLPTPPSRSFRSRAHIWVLNQTKKSLKKQS